MFWTLFLLLPSCERELLLCGVTWASWYESFYCQRYFNISPINRKKKKKAHKQISEINPRVWKGTCFQPSVTTSPMGTRGSHHSFVKAVSQVQLAMPEWMLPHTLAFLGSLRPFYIPTYPLHFWRILFPSQCEILVITKSRCPLLALAAAEASLCLIRL